MSAEQVGQQAVRVLLARCCDHAQGEVCECREQVAADVEVLARNGLLRDGRPDVVITASACRHGDRSACGGES